LPAKLGGNGLRFGLELEIARLKLGPIALETHAIGRRGAQRLALGEEKVAREAVLDGDDIAHLSEPADALKKDDLHLETPFRV
jgi:hypothetical protein